MPEVTTSLNLAQQYCLEKYGKSTENYTGFRWIAADVDQRFSYENDVQGRPLVSGLGAFTLQGSQVRNLHFPPRISF